MLRHACLIAALALLLTACGDAATPPADAPPAARAAPVTDPELEAVQGVTPVDACAWLTPEMLRTLHPDLVFEVRQRLEPRLSGYAWDSRCTYWAGVGTIEFAKDTPTHTVEIFVNTPASEAKALANLASRRETATSTTGYQPRPELGADAYAVTQTGMASLFFVKQGSEVQINVSDLDSPNADKIRRAVALAQSL
ncbi:MAG: hypothetical protein LW860_04730 [Xanthomonadaceae bacterium]|jgi:hypothetical protein|nr:hypothetical protein [Xanthomonadaceae bacterium]